MNLSIMKRLGLLFGLLLMAGAVATASAQDFSQPPPVSPREFALMAWGGTPSNPTQLEWMRQAGLNITGFCSPDQLDKVNAAGLTCFVADPRANHYDWEDLPHNSTIQKNIDSLVSQVANHPAALGFFMMDEPNASQLPGIGHIVSLLRHSMPSKWSYVNLLPNYASPSQLGAPSYKAYLQKFIGEVHPSVLSYDNYSLFNGEMLDRFYTNLGIVRRVCLKAHIIFWNVILSNSHFTYMEPSSATLRLQAYATMAYGGRGIEYYTYFAPPSVNYRLAPVDQFGHRTTTWNKLRLLNSQIRELAPWLARLRSTGVYHSAPVPKGENPMSGSRLVKDVLASTYQKPAVQPRYLIGEFLDPDGHRFLMIVNKDLEHSLRFAIQLRQKNKHLFKISPYTGREGQSSAKVDWLAPGAGELFEVK